MTFQKQFIKIHWLEVTQFNNDSLVRSSSCLQMRTWTLRLNPLTGMLNYGGPGLFLLWLETCVVEFTAV